MDMLDLAALPDGSFDAVVDKAAMDALMCDEGSVWDPDPRTREDARRMCHATSRVLRPGGVFVQISFAQPHFRRRYLAGFAEGHDDDGALVAPYGWHLSHAAFGAKGCLETFLYTCKKEGP